VSRPVVVVYTRERCGLCRSAEAVVAREARGADVRHVDIDTDDDLVARYTIRVPVVAVDGVEVAEGQVAPGQVRAAVRAAARSARRRPRRDGGSFRPSVGEP
jgi:glutaredoxin